MVEKFNLTWSNYQTVITRSFSQLRNDTDLSDVTLISDDQEPIPAHRVVLSTCSEFFKSVFHKNVHANLVLFLSDMKSNEVNQILDYIYYGEIHLFQDHIERFLQIAQKLKLEGMGDPTAQNEEGEVKNTNSESQFYPDYKTEDISNNVSNLMTYANSEFSESQINPTENKSVVLAKSPADTITALEHIGEQSRERKNRPSYRPPAFDSEVDVQKLDQKN